MRKQLKEKPLCSVAACQVRTSGVVVGATEESLREGLGGLALRDVQPGKIFWPLCEEHQELRWRLDKALAEGERERARGAG